MKKIILYIFSLTLLSSAMYNLNANETQSTSDRSERFRGERFRGERFKSEDYRQRENPVEEKVLEYVKESRVEIRNRLARNVSSNSQGDVEISLPSMSNVKKPSSEKIPLALGCLVKYTLPTLNLEEMYKALAELKDARIDLMLPATDTYLATRNAGIRFMSYSQSSVKSMIDSGLPIFVYLKSDNASFQKIAQRSESRPIPRPSPFSSDDNPFKKIEDYREKESKSEMRLWMKTYCKAQQLNALLTIEKQAKVLLYADTTKTQKS